MDRRQFCDTVTRQLRCRWEAPAVRQELSDHIQDHQAALMAEGMDRDQAEEAAVAAMGDPEALGKALDALHSPWPWRIYHAARTAAFVLLVFAFFLGFDVLLGSGGSGAVFWGDSGYTQPEQDPQSLLEYYSFIDSDTVRTTGTVTGGGDIGPYRLSPAGEALFLTQENGDTQLAFLVSTFHPQPWLESLKLYDLACSALDDLGNQYSSDQFYFLNTGGRLRDLCWVLLYDPDPTARRFTFTLDTDRGSVTFTITPEGGENA